MLSIKSLGTADSGLANYYESLARDDYYTDGGEPPGQWHGALAEQLKLTGTVRPGQLASIFMGMHPVSGKPLATNAGPAHKAGWDLTFSAPKSVSLVWAIGDSDTQNAVAAAHNVAVEVALNYVEQRAFRSRDRQDPGAGRGATAVAMFPHSTSRELDPQLHTHSIVANVGQRIDGSFCALDFDSRWKMAAGAMYRAELAHQLQQLGFGIERDGCSFRLQGVEQRHTNAFSTRRRQILAELATNGHASAKAAGIAALATRQAKGEVDRQTLMPLWRAQASAIGLDEPAVERLRLQHEQQQADGHIDIDAIVQSLTYSQSSFTRMQLETAVATAAQGMLSAKDTENLIQTTIAERTTSQAPLGLVRLRSLAKEVRRDAGVEHYTTREMLAMERAIIAAAIRRKDDAQQRVSAVPGLLAHSQLSEEQVHALRHVTESPGAVAIVRGLAGTGKSTLLAAAHDCWKEGGLRVIGAALAGKAADGLQHSSSINSQTLHSLIAELDNGHRQLSNRDVVVIDETGMVGTRQLQQILDHVHCAGAKAVLVGDPAQLQPIEAGGMFPHLSDLLGHAQLTDIRRQEKLADREMIERLLVGDVDAVLADLEARHMLVTAPGLEIQQRMVEAWMKQWNPARPDETLMLAGTRSEVYWLNMLAREHLINAGLLNGSLDVDTEHGLREFSRGERVLFTRNDKRLNVRNGQTGTLLGWKDFDDGHRYIDIALDDGQRVRVDPMEYRHLDYGYALSVHKAQGQTVDHTLVLMGDMMTDREWSYVAASRHRTSFQIYVPKEQHELIASQMARSRQKVVACELQVEQSDEMEC